MELGNFNIECIIEQTSGCNLSSVREAASQGVIYYNAMSGHAGSELQILELFRI